MYAYCDLVTGETSDDKISAEYFSKKSRNDFFLSLKKSGDNLGRYAEFFSYLKEDPLIYFLGAVEDYAISEESKDSSDFFLSLLQNIAERSKSEYTSNLRRYFSSRKKCIEKTKILSFLKSYFKSTYEDCDRFPDGYFLESKEFDYSLHSLLDSICLSIDRIDSDRSNEELRSLLEAHRASEPPQCR